MGRTVSVFAAAALVALALTPHATAQAITCPATAAGANPQVLSICSKLFASLSAQRTTKPTGPISAKITFKPPPTTTKSFTSRSTVGAGTLTTSATTSTSPTTIATTRTSLPPATSTRSTASSASSAQPPSAQHSPSPTAAAAPGPTADHTNSANYRNHVVIPAAVVCSVVGAAIIAALIWVCLIRPRRRDRHEESLEAGATYAAAEKQSPAAGDFNGDESPILPALFASGNASAQQPAYYPPAARYSNTNATPRGVTPEVPPYPIERPTASPTPSDSTPPWRVQPLRHFRRFSDPLSEEATDSNAGTTDTVPGPTNGLAALREENEGELPSRYATPAGQGGQPWNDIPPINQNNPNRGLWSSWLSSSSGISGSATERPLIRPAESAPTGQAHHWEGSREPENPATIGMAL